MLDLNITIGFSTTTLMRSRIIRWVTRSAASHAWIAFDDAALGTRMVMQAETWGYEVRPWTRWCDENILVKEFKPTGARLEESLRWLAQRIGSKYDYKAAFLAGLRRWFGAALRGSLHSPKQLMCSEAVTRFLQHANYAATHNLDPEITSPSRLLKIINNSPKEFIQARL